MKKIAIVGAGKVGIAIGHALSRAGYSVGFTSKSSSSVDAAQRLIPTSLKLASPAESADFGDAVLIATPDAEIAAAASALGTSLEDKCVFHLSGATSIESLASARSSGASVGCIHPLQSFATVERAIALLPGSFFGLTVDSSARARAEEIIKATNGRIINVRDEDKPLYHAAASVASNFFIALIHYASGILEAAKIPPPLSAECLFPLIQGSLENAKELGMANALTGPIARGDAETVKKHLAALSSSLPDSLPTYVSLAGETLRLAAEKGTLKEDRARAIEAALADIS